MEQEDLGFCKNEESKRYKNCKRGDQQLLQNVSKWSNERYLWKIRQIFAQIISGTKCDRDKLIFSAEREGEYDRVGHKKGPNEIGKCQKRRSIERKLPTMFKYESAPPLPGFNQHDTSACYISMNRNADLIRECELGVGVLMLGMNCNLYPDDCLIHPLAPLINRYFHRGTLLMTQRLWHFYLNSSDSAEQTIQNQASKICFVLYILYYSLSFKVSLKSYCPLFI